MDFDFTEEQELLRKTIVKFIKQEIPIDLIRDMDEKEYFPNEIWQKMAQVGFLSCPVPVEYGGAGGNIIDDTIIIEELSRAASGLGLWFMVTVCFGARSLDFLGNEKQKRFFLPQIASGHCKFSLAITEPGGGTDILGNLATFGFREGEKWVIHGRKVFISGAQQCNYLVTVARTDRKAPKLSKGITLFIIDSQAEGLEMKKLAKLGGRCCDTNEIIFDHVPVPPDGILGEEGQGWYNLLSTLNNERIGTAALSLGIGRASFEYALQYAKERVAFGRPIGQFQAIQHYLADSATEIEMARLLTYQSAWLQANGRRCDVQATMAKLVSSEVSFRVASRGMDILAGYGYMMEYDMQRYFRDCRQYTLGPISNEMARNYIGQSLGLPKSY